MNQKARAASLKRKYNLTVPQWDTIFKFQKGLCAICDRPASDFTNSFSVDHDHSTRAVRGLLCFNCNSLIPNRKDLIKLLGRVISYLQTPPAVSALGVEIKANPLRRKKRRKK